SITIARKDRCGCVPECRRDHFSGTPTFRPCENAIGKHYGVSEEDPCTRTGPTPTAERTRPRLQVARFERFENVLPGNGAQRALRYWENGPARQDRKSTRLNSSHDQISYA